MPNALQQTRPRLRFRVTLKVFVWGLAAERERYPHKMTHSKIKSSGLKYVVLLIRSLGCVVEGGRRGHELFCSSYNCLIRRNEQHCTASQQCLNDNSNAKWEEKRWTWDYRERWRL